MSFWETVREASKSTGGLVVRAAVIVGGGALLAKDISDRLKEEKRKKELAAIDWSTMEFRLPTDTQNRRS